MIRDGEIGKPYTGDKGILMREATARAIVLATEAGAAAKAVVAKTTVRQGSTTCVFCIL